MIPGIGHLMALKHWDEVLRRSAAWGRRPQIGGIVRLDHAGRGANRQTGREL